MMWKCISRRVLIKASALLGFATCLPLELAWGQTPAINIQPLPLSVGPGDRAGFVVSATGPKPLQYQWYHDGTPVAGANTDLLLIPAAQIADAGSYTVAVSHSLGSATSSAATLTVASYIKEWIDPDFQGTAGDIILVQPDGRCIVALKGKIVRLLANGRNDESFAAPAVDFPPASGLGASGFTSMKAVLRADGRCAVLASVATSVHASPYSYSCYLVVLNDDGSAYAAFPKMEFQSTRYSSELLLAVGDQLLVSVDGKVVRVSANGALDLSFASTSPLTPTGDGMAVTHGVFGPDGSIWVSDGRYLGRMSKDGRVDSAVPVRDLGGNLLDLIGSRQGGCWVATIEYHSPSLSYWRVRRLTGAGVIDPSFAEFSEVSSSVRLALTEQADGQLIVAGTFTHEYATDEAGRVAVRTGVLRLKTDGSLDLGFVPSNVSGLGSRWWLLPNGTHALVSASGIKRVGVAALGSIEPPRILRLEPLQRPALAGDDVALRVIAVGSGPLAIGSDINPTATSESITLRNAQVDRQITVAGRGGRATRSIAAELVPSAPRVISSLPPVTARPGQRLDFSAEVRGTDPITYEWYKDGAKVKAPSMASYDGSRVYFARDNITLQDAGAYSVKITNSLGTSVTSAVLSVGAASELSNLSVRARVGVGDEVMIVGFVTHQPKPLLIQAVGPELVPYGVTGALDDPTMAWYFSNGIVRNNDDGGTFAPWNDGLYRQTGATLLLAPTKSSELRDTAPGGVHSVVVSGAGGSTGVALAQIFDGTSSTDHLANLSARVFTGTGNDTAITGFIIRGNAPKRVLIRCVGPGLIAAGIPRPLLNPRLTLVDQGTQQVIRSNDDWEDNVDTAELADVTQRVGAFPLASGSKDSALLVTLAPGSYTALASGAGGSSGLVLLEVYDASVEFTR